MSNAFYFPIPMDASSSDEDSEDVDIDDDEDDNDEGDAVIAALAAFETFKVLLPMNMIPFKSMTYE